MQALHHSTATADSMPGFINSEIHRMDNKIQNAKQAAESKAAKGQAVSALRNAVSLVDGTLAKLRATNAQRARKAEVKPIEALGNGRTFQSEMPEFERGVTPVTHEPSGFLPRETGRKDAAKELLKALSGDKKIGIGKQAQTVEDMARAIEPVINRFDDIQKKPHLDTFSATLNTVPVVGIKNSQIMYLATDSDGSKTTVEWKLFSSLPTGVALNKSKNVNLFPHHGHFYLAVGNSVWKKEHRDSMDESLKQAVDNWPKMYVDEWVKIGDNVLLSGDIRSIIPFARLGDDGKTLYHKLLILRHDGTLQVLKGDNIYQTNTWDTLKYSGSQTPKWTRMAYWNDMVLAVDDHNQMWNISVDFDKLTYKADDKTKIDPASEFTATEVGPVAARSDGYLYKRFVEDVSHSEGTEPALKWTRWVKQDGVTNLGVASPGVLLDLQLLTRALKSRYIDTQTALYPMMTKIRSFTKAHGNWLTKLMAAAKVWEEAISEEEKEKIAIEQGKRFVSHARTWGKVLNTAIDKSQDSVNIMAQQIVGISAELEQQLALLREKLRGLEILLDTQKDALSKLQAAFWGSIAAMFLGMALGVIALATGVGAWALIGSGALFIAGFASMIAMGIKMAEMAREIAKTENQIRVTNEAISVLSDVVGNFTALEDIYGNIQMFWGRLKLNSGTINDFDKSISDALVDNGIFEQNLIESSQDENTALTNSIHLYLDILHKQGIKPPETYTQSPSSPAESSSQSSTNPFIFPPQSYFEILFQMEVDKANKMLAKGDFKRYLSCMDQALEYQGLQMAAKSNDRMRSGAWYNIPALTKAASLFNENATGYMAPRIAGSNLRSIDPSAIRNRVKTAGTTVSTMLRATISTSKKVQNLLDQYYKLKKAGKWEEIKKLKDTILADAITECQSAVKNARLANNAFVEVNHAATTYEQGLERRQNSLRDDIRSARAYADQELNNITIPWQVAMGGSYAINAYRAERRQEIEKDYRSKVAEINKSISVLKSLQQSGAVIKDQSLTWTEMVQTVSQCLGSVYNCILTVKDFVEIDPKEFEQLIKIEWAILQKDSQAVLDILASQGVTRGSLIKTVGGLRHQKLIQALTPAPKLGSHLQTQANDAGRFFTQMQTLLRLPFLGDIIGYWDDEQAEKTTLLDVVTRVRRQYIDMMSAEYSLIDSLYTMSLLQKKRAQWVKDGKLSLELFVKSSLKSAQSAQQAAQATANKFQNASSDYRAVLRHIDVNLDEIKKKISQLDVDITKLNQEMRNKIIWVIADVIALCFATAALLASLGAFGPIAAKLALSVKLGLGAAATAASIKLTIDSLELADIAALMARLLTIRQDLDTSKNELETVKPLFGNVVQGVNFLHSTTTQMADALSNLANDSAALDELSLLDKDVQTIGHTWDSINDASLQWIDVINKQGIKPQEDF
ncbi:hypothetical protein BDW75DRAFT_246243 [Aspergillus navahoensis]